LVGKIGVGNFFEIGTSFSGPANAAGELKLFYWDSNFSDNTQYVTAQISAATRRPRFARPDPKSLILNRHQYQRPPPGGLLFSRPWGWPASATSCLKDVLISQTDLPERLHSIDMETYNSP
jgi:hypothetical protein